MTGICALRTALRDALRTHQTAILDALGWGKRPLIGRRGRPGVRAVPKTPLSYAPHKGRGDAADGSVRRFESRRL